MFCKSCGGTPRDAANGICQGFIKYNEVINSINIIISEICCLPQ